MVDHWLKVWPFLQPHKKMLLFALFLGLLLGQLSILLPALIELIIAGFQEKSLLDIATISKTVDYLGVPRDSSFLNIDHQKLVLYVAFCFPAYYLVYGLIRYFHFFIFKYTSEKIVNEIRVRLMNKFMDLDVLYFNRQQSGSAGLLSRTLNDTLILQQGLQYYGDLIREPIVGFFLIVYMFYINWKMTLACFLFLPVFLVVIRYVSRSLKKFGHQSQESLEEVTKTLKEGLDGVRIIQSFNLQEMVKKRFAAQADDYLNKRKKIVKREELGSPLNEWFASILICGICLFQAQLIWRGESDVGTFIAFIVAAGLLDKPVKKGQQAVIRVQQNIVAIERLHEVLNSESRVLEAKTPVKLPQSWQELQFKGVEFSYKNKKVLHNINLNIKRGEVVAIVGESGSGKTTIVNLLQRFFDPQKGEILMDNTPIKNFSIEDLRSQIALVTQDVFLFDDSLTNNIWFGDLTKSKDEVQKAAEMANATGFIGKMSEGFETKVGERGSRLSGGEKQRVSIARAIFKDPPILILDEATSALDSASELEVQKGIQQLLKGRTAIVIAHRLSTIIHSDRILVMKNGHIIEDGNHESLLSRKGEYAHFYNLQFGG